MSAHAQSQDLVLFAEEIHTPQVKGGIISFSIRKDATEGEILNTLSGACEAYTQISRVTDQLKLVIGKTLAVIKERKMFGEYKTFERFLQEQVVDKFGIGRSTAWEAIKVAQAFPELTAEQYTQKGASRMIAIARDAAKLPPEQQGAVMEIVGRAETMDLDEVKQATRALLTPEQQEEDENVPTLSIKMTQEELDEWVVWTKRKDVQDAAGGPSRKGIFLWTLRFADSCFHQEPEPPLFKGGAKKVA